MRPIDADALLERAIPMGWSTPLWVSDIAIQDAPTIEPEQKKGKWIPVRLGDCKCSLCGETYGIVGGLLGSYNYCPNCGADMREEK